MLIENTLSAAIILLVVIGFVALLLLLRKFAFLIISRIFRASWRVFARVFRILAKPIARVLRLLRIISKVPSTTQPAVAVESVVGLSVGALAHAFASENEEAIARNFDTASIDIQRNKQFFCTWLSPPHAQHLLYDRKRAEDELTRAKEFFTTDVPTGSNPLNLYDDIEAGFIVKLLNDSDKSCFHILTEFKKTINANVIALSILFSAIVSVVAVLNILASTSVSFHYIFGIQKYLPVGIDLFATKFELNITSDFFDRALFGILSCFVAYFLMWFFYHTEYAQFQRYNGQQMNNFLVEHFASINIDFRQIHTNATETILEERGVDEMKFDAALWMTNLQWTAFRAFFMEWYLRNILFQIRRNSSYYLFLIPLLFIVAMLIAAYAFDVRQLNVFDLGAGLYKQNTFYPFFAWLLFVYYGYMSRSVSFIWESIEDRRWSKFRDLNIQAAMTRISDGFVVQLDRWRSMMKSRA